MSLFVLNLTLALVWYLLADEPHFTHLVSGFILGYFMIYIYRPVFGNRPYLKRNKGKKSDYVVKTINFVKFFFWFFFIFIKSNLNIAWAVLTRSNEKIIPRLFEIDTTNLTTLEILILSQCITLTPGTTSVDIYPDQNTLLVHAFDGEDIEEERSAINDDLIPRIKSFMR